MTSYPLAHFPMPVVSPATWIVNYKSAASRVSNPVHVRLALFDFARLWLESVMRSKRASADVSKFMDSSPGLPRLRALRRQPNLLKRINVNCRRAKFSFCAAMPNDVV